MLALRLLNGHRGKRGYDAASNKTFTELYLFEATEYFGKYCVASLHIFFWINGIFWNLLRYSPFENCRLPTGNPQRIGFSSGAANVETRSQSHHLDQRPRKLLACDKQMLRKKYSDLVRSRNSFT